MLAIKLPCRVEAKKRRHGLKPKGEVRFEEFSRWNINLMSDQVMGVSECPS